ncbi:unnamed protein product, partial [Oppiella nova]
MIWTKASNCTKRWLIHSIHKTIVRNGGHTHRHLTTAANRYADSSRKSHNQVIGDRFVALVVAVIVCQLIRIDVWHRLESTKISRDYPVVDHTYDAVVVGAGGAGLRA